jgi:glycosyltransferase involved in cell wall biosynthesis
MLALADAGHDITWVPLARTADSSYRRVGVEAAEHPDPRRLAEPGRDPDTVVAHTTPEYFPGLRARHPGALVVGHTVWDTDRLPRHWAPLLEVPDLIVVPCRWNAGVIRAGGVTTPVAVVPHAVTRVARRRAPAWDRVPPDRFVFYTIATWTARKAVWSTLRAYLRAFTSAYPVLLVVKTSPFYHTHTGPIGPGGSLGTGTVPLAVARLLREFPDPAEVRVVTRDLTAFELAALHTRGDCFVSLCRSEGWGIPAFDAAAYGNPVVITGYGGQLDYLEPGLSFLVDHELVAVRDPAGYPSFTPDQRWAEPSVESGAALLRRVFEDREGARALARRQAGTIRHRYRAASIAAAFAGAVAAARGAAPTTRVGV